MRTMVISITLVAVLITGSCGSEPAVTRVSAVKEVKKPRSNDIRVRDAEMLAQLYSRSRLSAWDVRATAAGSDCAVLFITTTMLLEDSLIDALHYGSGAYDIYDGGIHEFYRRRAFRGVAYQDRSKRIWTFGGVSQVEATSLTPCQ
ncbi:MAG TPA: hypothetical protein VGQ76_24235 [Thermoanaerobaculia bacterium]|jgi:hypothetical protein|nr:hypothetical protein [Thermoanaerobaculia bacterium]